MSELADKHVVITGATGALGMAVIAAFFERGATCHVPMVEASAPAAWQDEPRIVATPRVMLDSEPQVSAYYAALPPLWASIHLVGGFTMAPIADTSLADFERMHALNAVTCFLTCREAVRAMRRAGAGNGGRIVNVAARPALVPTGGMVAYAASKAAVASITQSLAAEVVSEGILVNAIAPSIIDTAANRTAMPEANHACWPKPAELARAIAYLASPANALTSGAVVPVYGAA